MQHSWNFAIHHATRSLHQAHRAFKPASRAALLSTVMLCLCPGVALALNCPRFPSEFPGTPTDNLPMFVEQNEAIIGDNTGTACSPSRGELSIINNEATLTISAGGQLFSDQVFVTSNSVVTPSINVTGTGSKLEANDLVVGNYGRGALNIKDGGQVTVYDSLFIGHEQGSISLDGDNTYDFGLEPSAGTVAVTGKGSVLQANAIYVGRDLVPAGYLGVVNSTGTLTISNGGGVSAAGGNGTINIALASGSTGTLTIGAAAGQAAQAAGTVQAAEAAFGSGTGAVVFNHTDTDYVFAPKVSGSGTLAFYSGTTTLTGDYSAFTGTAEVYKTGALNLTSAYTGKISLNSGTVFTVNGTHTNNFQVLSGATLGGNGRIGAVTLAAGALLAPGNASNGLVTNGIRFEPGSTFQVGVNGSGFATAVVSTGKVSISGGATLSVVAADEAAYKPSTSYPVLTSIDGLEGRFSTVTDNLAFLDASVAYTAGLDTHFVTLTLNRATTPDGALLSFASKASRPNGKSVAGTIDATGSGALHDAVLSMREGETEQAFQMLSGEAHATVQRTIMSGSSASRSSMTQRILTATGGVGGSTGTQVSTAFNGKGGVPLAKQIGAQVWSQATGGWGRTDATASTAAAESYGGGFLTGVDAEIIPGWRTGLMAGYSRNQFSSSANRSSGSADTYQAGIYAGTQMDAIGLRLGASYAWHNLDTRRDVAFTGFADRLAAAYSASTAQAFAEIGYALHLTPATVEPFAGIAVINQHTDGFTETGGPAALNSRSSNDVLGVTTLGLRGEAAIGQIGGFTTSLSGSLAWRHAFGDVTPSSTLRFANSGSAFTISGTPLDRDAALFEAGLSLKNDQALGLTLAYQSELGATTQTHAGRLSLQYRF
ncbi:autotransporter outer membrane beta-barrel domain-containing protein [Pannonibacter phragmitetus]|uniref:autotransporter outer membrane beta-barrel domain-containing protein n=1 Tax=Pannonibacter phragmitetus TaxID=121719 RepID=UPI003D2EED30